MKFKFALYIMLIAFFAVSLNLKAQGSGPINQFFYEECEWFVTPEPVECSQDWYLFAYWPLTCERICDFDEFCIGLFPSSQDEQVYDVDETTLCTRFRVEGQFMWLFDASGTVTYDQAGVVVDFLWYEGANFFLANNLIIPQTGQGFGPNQFALTTPTLPPFSGEWWFKVCADQVTISPGFNGLATIHTVMTFIYSV